MILSINYLYWLAGIILTITALMTFADKNHPRRWTCSGRSSPSSSLLATRSHRSWLVWVPW